MSKLVSFDEYERGASELLEDIAGMSFDTVVIVGISGNEVHIKSSGPKDTIRALGCLRAAEDHILKNWE